VPEPDDSLNAKIQEYYKCVQEEFARDTADGDLDVEAVEKDTKRILLQAVPKAVETLVDLLQFGDKDSVRAQAAKYIIDKALGTGAIADSEDEMEKLVKQLTKGSPDVPNTP
jgi:hypothetical protein